MCVSISLSVSANKVGVTMTSIILWLSLITHDIFVCVSISLSVSANKVGVTMTSTFLWLTLAKMKWDLLVLF